MKYPSTILLLLSLASSAFALTEMTAQEILKAIDDNQTFAEGEMSAAMIDYKKGRINKQLFMSMKYKRGTGTLLEFLRPAREQNKKILMVKDNMWMFVPGISKPVRLSGRDSFMGTSFSNRDMTDFDMNADYSAKFLENSEKFCKLELTATNKNVSYSKIIIDVEKEHLLPVREELYTVSGNLIKTIDFSELKNLGGKLRPSVMIIREVLSKGNETKVVIESMTSRQINEDIFSPQNLGR